MGIIQKTDEFLESIQTIHKPSTFSQKLNIQQGDITFENVSFSYSKNLPILKNINLRIYPNTKVCIIGQSGSGKSTLLKLLLKFYIPTSGTIYIDGKNIQDYDTNHLRKQISYVNQNTKLFNKSIYENIQYSNPNLTTQMIDHKIQEYGIQDIFKNINYNLQTSVGVQGNKLSGGQRQAIIILRELLNPSKILILDEPTASIDETNKQYIYQLIDKMKNEKTIIVITHDLHNLELYDQIYLLKNYQLTPYTTPL
jgi:ABC-type bacteriocin/lantibiotic exporter with double-glycine peptidase domain